MKVIVADHGIIKNICLTNIAEKKNLKLISLGELHTYLVSDEEASRYQIGDKYVVPIGEKLRRAWLRWAT